MHVRFSSCRGLPIVLEGEEGAVGYVSDILIHPDTGHVEGFFIAIPRFMHSEQLFLPTIDILRFSTHISIADPSALCLLSDIIRLEPLIDDPRTVLGQSIRTKSGLYIGRCCDVQFSTEHMNSEWLFPKRWFRWGIALPMSDVLEITDDAIITKETTVFAKERIDAHTESLPNALPEKEAALMSDT